MEYLITYIVFYISFLIWCIRGKKFDGYEASTVMFLVLNILGGVAAVMGLILTPASDKFEKDLGENNPIVTFKGKECLIVPKSLNMLREITPGETPKELVHKNIFGVEFNAGFTNLKE